MPKAAAPKTPAKKAKPAERGTRQAAPAPAPKPRQAIHVPVNTPLKDMVHTGDIILPPEEINLGETINGTLTAIRQEGGNFEKVIHDEEFYKDLLMIHVSAAGENENPYAVTVVNNRHFQIPRGRNVRVPRFVVEALAHAKQANFKTKRTYVGDPTHMAPIQSHVFSYPFSVIQDPRGVEGQKWLEKVLNDPQ